MLILFMPQQIKKAQIKQTEQQIETIPYSTINYCKKEFSSKILKIQYIFFIPQFLLSLHFKQYFLSIFIIQYFLENILMISDAQFDAVVASNPKSLLDAVKLMALIGKNGWQSFQTTCLKHFTYLNSRPAGYGQHMGQYYKGSNELEGLTNKIAIESLKEGGYKHTISNPSKLDQMLKESHGQHFSTSKVKTDNIKLQKFNLELHAIQMKNSQTLQTFLLDQKLIVDGKNIKLEQIKKLVNQRKLFAQKVENLDNQINMSASQGKTAQLSPLAKSIAKIKFQAGLGAAFSAIFNWKLLLSKQFGKFFFEVGKGGGIGLAQGALTQSIHSTFGEAAGPVAGFLIVAIFDTKAAVDTGDWARFGKNLGSNAVGTAASAGLGYLATMGLASFAVTTAWVTIPVLIGASLIGFFGGSWIAKKITPLGNMTDHELKQVYKVYNENLKAQGCEIGTDFKEFSRQFEKGNISIKTQHNYAQLAQESSQNLSKLLIDKVFRGTMKTIFTFAKYTSPTGDIPSGLKLLIAKLQ